MSILFFTTPAAMAVTRLRGASSAAASAPRAIRRRRHDTFSALIGRLQARLDARCDPSYKRWLERYMRGATPARGVRMAEVREALEEWRVAENLSVTHDERAMKRLAMGLFAGPATEDKLAGTLLLAGMLGGGLVLGDLPKLAELYESGGINDWNVCDWFALKVISPLVVENGAAGVAAVSRWAASDILNVWRARTGLVGLLGVIGGAEAAQHYGCICEAARGLIRRDERFAKTAVGWVLREVAKKDRTFVMEFVDDELANFSAESLRNVLKHDTDRVRKGYLGKLKELQAVPKLPCAQ